MPYKSARQRRFMHAQHPGIARRWDQEYGGKVGKGHTAIGKRLTTDGEVAKMTYFGPLAGKELRAAATAAEEHAFKTARPRPGGGFPVRDGGIAARSPQRKGFLSRLRRRQSQSFGKGVARQSVQPRLARRAALAGTGGRRVLTGDPVNARRVIGKSDEVAKLSFGSAKGGFRAFRGGAQSGYLGMKPSSILPNSQLGRMGTGQRRLLGAGQRLGSWTANSPHQALGAAAGAGAAGGMFVPRRRREPYAKALRPVGVGLGPRVDSARRAEEIGSVRRRMTGGGDVGNLRAGMQTVRRRGKILAPDSPTYRQGLGYGSRMNQFRMRGVSKVHGDPEDARYARLGAGSALLGAGGVAGLGYAAREGRGATRIARSGAAFGGYKPDKGKRPLLIELEEPKSGAKIPKAIVVDQRKLNMSRRLTRGGLAITGRGAAAGAGGVAALGGAEALRRKASDRRWS